MPSPVLTTILHSLILLLPSYGAEILRNQTFTPGLRSPFRAPLDPSVGRVLVFLTAVAKEHSSSDHMSDLYHLWPVILRKNRMLKSADVLIHVAVGGDSHRDEITFRHIEMCVEAFPNKEVRLFFVKNPGYQEGAIEAMLDGARHRWFEGYDW